MKIALLAMALLMCPAITLAAANPPPVTIYCEVDGHSPSPIQLGEKFEINYAENTLNGTLVSISEGIISGVIPSGGATGRLISIDRYTGRFSLAFGTTPSTEHVSHGTCHRTGSTLF